VIILCVRWYLCYKLSFRDLVEMMAERGLHLSHTTIMRWVQRYAPEFERRWTRFARKVGRSWRVDETYLKVRGRWVYLYRAVDRDGDTVDFRLSPTRDVAAAKAFFRKALRTQKRAPVSITLDGALVNASSVSLKTLHVFHMDECLDWEGKPLPAGHPYNFKTFMERHFYGGIRPELAVPEELRHWLLPATMEEIRAAINEAPIDITVGGWGQHGHVAYNQARRHPFHHVTLDQIANSSIRIQENNIDTIVALAQRTFGAAYQFVPPMSITLGMRECLSAKKVRVYSDTGAWKQTALRVALFSEPTPEYPMTLLQTHPDAIITATLETSIHPISENPDWGEHAKLWGGQAAAAGWSRSTNGLKPRCQCRKASSNVALST
jgi:glucosamine-6-phosphate deaminase